MKQLAYQTTFLALIAFITPTLLKAQTKALPKESLKVTITGAQRLLRTIPLILLVMSIQHSMAFFMLKNE